MSAKKTISKVKALSKKVLKELKKKKPDFIVIADYITAQTLMVNDLCDKITIKAAAPVKVKKTSAEKSKKGSAKKNKGRF